MPRLCHARGLHDPPPPGWLLIAAVPPQLCIAVIPTPRGRIPIMRLSLHLPALHIHIPLNDCRDAASFADIAAQRKRLVRISTADIPRFWPMVRSWGRRAATISGLAAGKEDAEEWAQGRGGGGDDSDADLDGGPDCNVHGGIEEIADVGHAADEWNANDCSS